MTKPFHRKYPKSEPPSFEPSIRFEYLRGLDPMDYELMLIINETNDSWDISLAHMSTGVGNAQARKIANEFTAVLGAMIADSQQSIGNVLGSLIK
jgi:hypothetical protein